jgi:hypothetical protein
MYKHNRQQQLANKKYIDTLRTAHGSTAGGVRMVRMWYLYPVPSGTISIQRTANRATCDVLVRTEHRAQTPPRTTHHVPHPPPHSPLAGHMCHVPLLPPRSPTWSLVHLAFGACTCHISHTQPPTVSIHTHARISFSLYLYRLSHGAYSTRCYVPLVWICACRWRMSRLRPAPFKTVSYVRVYFLWMIPYLHLHPGLSPPRPQVPQAQPGAKGHALSKPSHQAIQKPRYLQIQRR